MKEKLPWPYLKSEEDFHWEYTQKLRATEPEVVELSKQLRKPEKLMAAAVVLTPFLATDDRHFLPNYFAQYAKQTDVPFTLILYPNASLEVDPEREAVSESVTLIEKLKKEYPHLDVRYLVDEQPEEKFSTIGRLRKRFWDAALLAVQDDYVSSCQQGMPKVKAHLTLKEAISILPRLQQDRYFINHDVDVISIPRNFMRVYVATMVNVSLTVEAPHKPASFNSTMVHGRTPDHPNLDAVAAVYDYLFGSICSGFEAGIAIRSKAYAALGGFSLTSYTYEVAGLTNLMPNSCFYIKTPAIKTSPRRLYDRLPHVGVEAVWGTAGAGVYEDFNDKDSCRKVVREDISEERKNELVQEWAKEVAFSSFVKGAASYDYLVINRVKADAALTAVKNANSESERLIAWKQVEENYRGALEKRKTVLKRVLSAGRVTLGEELTKLMEEELEASVAEFLKEEEVALENF